MNYNNQVTSNPLYYEKPYKLLFKYAAPSIISMLVGSLYNIVDQIFIGQGIGINGNAATNVAFPLTIICMSIALFHGFGSASFYSILLGQGNNKKAATIIGNTIVSALTLGFIFTIIVKLFNKNFMIMFGSTKEVLPYAVEYTNITSLGFIPFIYPIFIFKFDMGMSGAALATIIGQFISFIIVFRYLFRFKHIKFERENFIVKPKNVLKVFSLGSSSGFNQLAMMVVQITMNNVLSYYGSNSIYGGNIPLAVAGIIAKINMLVMAFIIGSSQGSQPIIGFNYGAKNYDRVISTYRLTITITTIMAFTAFILFQTFPRQIVGIFGDGSDLYFRFAEEYMRIYMALMVINGIQPVTGTFFTSLGKAFKGAFISMTRQIIFLLPLIIILPRILGIDGVMYAGPVADGAALIVTVIMVSHEIKNLKRLKESNL